MRTASGRGRTRRPSEAFHCGVDAGGDVRVEDRRDGLEPALAAIRAGAHVDVVDEGAAGRPSASPAEARAHPLDRPKPPRRRRPVGGRHAWGARIRAIAGRPSHAVSHSARGHRGSGSSEDAAPSDPIRLDRGRRSPCVCAAGRGRGASGVGEAVMASSTTKPVSKRTTGFRLNRPGFAGGSNP